MKRGTVGTVLLVGAIVACSSSSGNPGGSGVATLDPTQPHFGKTYAEWAAGWYRWYYGISICEDDPIKDTTGQFCATNQSDPNVFFLTGTYGGMVLRDHCQVPKGKALFMPIVEEEFDNGGAAKPQTASALQHAAQLWLTSVDVSSLLFEVDGASITDFKPFVVDAYDFSYTMGPEPNLYDCFGVKGVTGVIKPSYFSGYWIMLAPLPSGAHTIHFAGKTSTAGFHLNVTYEFTVP